MNIQIDNLRQGYVELVEEIQRHGKPVAPRGMPTVELLNATVTLHDPSDALPIGIGRKPNLAIGAAEALQLIGGFSDPEMMASITKNFERFFDGGVLSGAYGPRIRTQLEHVVERLKQDPDTRQAIAVIWDPLHDGIGSVPRDLPCTLVLHFVIRDGKLSLCTTMRSNDVWWGVCYDFFQFTQLQLSIARVLKVKAGPYYHHATSLHMYERDFAAAEELHDQKPGLADEPRPRGLKGTSVAELQENARRIWSLDTVVGEGFLEHWYREQLRPHVRKTRVGA